ncbi:hypothetical protein [Listeria monocytogenes]|uniref:hypothetical protein n=1 Tax=Listeria monocytogenes TaxID=1639 RepID=UPI000E73AF8F
MTYLTQTSRCFFFFITLHVFASGFLLFLIVKIFKQGAILVWHKHPLSKTTRRQPKNTQLECLKQLNNGILAKRNSTKQLKNS